MSADPEIRRAHAARVPYLLPAEVGTHEGRHVRQRPKATPWVAYSWQQHTWHVAGGRLVLRPTTTGIPPHPDQPPELRDRIQALQKEQGIAIAPTVDEEPDDHWILTAWNPVGRPSTLAENLAANDRLREAVEDLGGVVGDVATTPPDRSWLEDSVLVAGIDDDAARTLAEAAGQPMYTALSPSRMSLRPTRFVQWPTFVCGREETVVPASCPMRTDDEPGALCAMHGGPWVSASIHAATVWQAHRHLLVTRLGCGPCADGTLPTLGPLGRTGGPIAVPGSELILASRYGGYAWR